MTTALTTFRNFSTKTHYRRIVANFFFWIKRKCRMEREGRSKKNVLFLSEKEENNRKYTLCRCHYRILK